uniref:Uncharacterized protein n=1 Tax=Pipistrellus kuhlii TaxID=59472 RepID=A0A7J7UTS9_PIPKU|nr:hypothetical protein mPipKuh1_008695 [Pipistrellus kuhlii]
MDPQCPVSLGSHSVHPTLGLEVHGAAGPWEALPPWGWLGGSTGEDFSEAINTKTWEKTPRILCTFSPPQNDADLTTPLRFFFSDPQMQPLQSVLSLHPAPSSLPTPHPSELSIRRQGRGASCPGPTSAPRGTIHPSLFLSAGKCFPHVSIPPHVHTPTDCLVFCPRGLET